MIKKHLFILKLFFFKYINTSEIQCFRHPIATLLRSTRICFHCHGQPRLEWCTCDFLCRCQVAQPQPPPPPTRPFSRIFSQRREASSILTQQPSSLHTQQPKPATFPIPFHSNTKHKPLSLSIELMYKMYALASYHH